MEPMYSRQCTTDITCNMSMLFLRRSFSTKISLSVVLALLFPSQSFNARFRTAFFFLKLLVDLPLIISKRGFQGNNTSIISDRDTVRTVVWPRQCAVRS